MRLIVLTQKVDPEHPALGATVPKLRALAVLVDELVVLADEVVPGALPAGVRAGEFGSRSRLGRGARFEALLARELARGADAVLAHMIPLYAVLAAVPAKARRARLLLWFTHWRLSPTLRLAERLCDAVLSVDRRSFPLDSAKLVPIGHGIDLGAFACRDGRAAAGGDSELRALVLGRYSEAKGLATLLRAAALEPRVRVAVHGPALNEAERRHRRELAALAAELDLGVRVELGDAVPPGRARALLAGADVLVNNMRAGAADKAVLEACASCVPVLASDPGWAETLDGLELPLRFGREKPEELAARLAALAAADAETRARIGRALRDRVEARHSVESWARGVVEAAR